MKVAIIQCPVWGVADPPLALAQLAGCLWHANIEFKVFDLNIALWAEAPSSRKTDWAWEHWASWNDAVWARNFCEEHSAELDRFAAKIAACEPDVALFSVHAGAQNSSLDMAERLRGISPRLGIVMGGEYFSDFEETAAAALGPGGLPDVVVSGAGEDVVVKLLGLMGATRRWMALPGVWVRNGNGWNRGPRPVPFTFDLDLSPPLDFSGFPNVLAYENPVQMPMSSSRGCPWSCRFCSSRSYWPRYSFKSGDRIFGDVARALSHQPAWRHVAFYDIVANGRPETLKRFAELSMEHGLSQAGMTWSMNAVVRPEMEPGLLDIMSRSGCKEIVYGIESASPALLDFMGRPPYTPSLAERVIKDTRMSGINAWASMIVGHPQESPSEFQATMKWLEALRGSLSGVVANPYVLEAAARKVSPSGAPGADATTVAGRIETLRNWCGAREIPIKERVFSLPPQEVAVI
jgi:radical SAM superfamily enzyme YgiQ (UPF0313 family)